VKLFVQSPIRMNLFVVGPRRPGPRLCASRGRGRASRRFREPASLRCRKICDPFSSLASTPAGQWGGALLDFGGTSAPDDRRRSPEIPVLIVARRPICPHPGQRRKLNVRRTARGDVRCMTCELAACHPLSLKMFETSSRKVALCRPNAKL
jgi:hypothetical protein